MRSERRRYRRIRRVEFGPLVRVRGDEGVDELESGNFLLALAGGECAEAELIDAVADAGCQRYGKAKQLPVVRSGSRLEEPPPPAMSRHNGSRTCAGNHRILAKNR